MSSMSVGALVVVAGLTILVTAAMRASGGWGGVAKGTGVYMVAVALSAAAAVLAIVAIRLLAA